MITEAHTQDGAGPTASTEGLDCAQRTSTLFESLRQITKWDWAKIGAVNTVAAVFSGGVVNVASTTVSFAVAYWLGQKVKKQGFNATELKRELYLGGVVAPALNYMFQAVHLLQGALYRWLAWATAGEIFINIYVIGAQTVLENYSLKTLSRKISSGEIWNLPAQFAANVRNRFTPYITNTLKYLGAPYYIILCCVPRQWKIPASALIRIGYRFGIERGRYKKETLSRRGDARASGRSKPGFRFFSTSRIFPKFAL